MNGFRKMISDNIPSTWDLALRWCHCRQYWIDTTYNIYIARYNNDYRPLKVRNKLKSDEIKRITHKMKINGKYMLFEDTVNLESLLINSDVLYAYWYVINNWVKWFEKNYTYIVSTANIQIQCKGKSIDEVAEYINQRYNMNDMKLAHYILNSISC